MIKSNGTIYCEPEQELKILVIHLTFILTWILHLNLILFIGIDNWASSFEDIQYYYRLLLLSSQEMTENHPEWNILPLKKVCAKTEKHSKIHVFWTFSKFSQFLTMAPPGSLLFLHLIFPLETNQILKVSQYFHCICSWSKNVQLNKLPNIEIAFLFLEFIKLSKVTKIFR